MIFYPLSKKTSDYIIKDIREDVPIINNVSFRKQREGYFFYDKDNILVGKINKVGYEILRSIDGVSNCGEILEKVHKQTNMPLAFLARLFIIYMKNFQDMELISMPEIKVKKSVPKIVKKHDSFVFLSVPVQIAVLLTNECNLRCSHCGNENRDRKENELTKEEWFKVIDECGKMGVFVFNISGGEPFVRKDWYDIMGYARKNGIEIGITSNGTLIDENIARQLKELDIFNIHLSLDGIGAVHDNFRNKEGVFDKVMDSMELLRKHGVPFGITTAVSKRNFQDLDNLAGFVKEKGINSWEIYYAVPIGCMKKEEVLTLEEIDQLAAKISQYKKDLKDTTRIFVGDSLGYHSRYDLQDDWKGCKAGLSGCAIDPEGNVKGCPIHPNEFIEGNVKDTSFSEIWNNKDAFSYNRNPVKLDKHCGKCKHGRTCRAGCKASMYSQGIKDFKHNDICLYHLEDKVK